MTQPTILCFHKDCEASSRLFNNFKATKMGGEHPYHDCDEVIDLQAMLKDYDFESIWQMKNLMTANVDVFCQNLKKECVQLIDQYANYQKKYITQQELKPSFIEYTKCMLLIKAIIENELHVLEENQKFFFTLRKIDQILENERIQTKKFDLEVINQNNLLGQRLQQCFNLQQDVSHETINKIKDLEQKLIQAEEWSTQHVKAQNEQACQVLAIKHSLQAAEQKYHQLEVKYNDKTKDVKILQDQLQAQQKEMDLKKQELCLKQDPFAFLGKIVKK